MNWLLEKKWLLCLSCLLLYLSFVRYKGFDCDAALYLLQVMNYLQPERFINDVPFMFGNQDSFSIFSPIISQIYKALGVNLGGIVCTLMMLCGWSFFSFALINVWSRMFGFTRWLIPALMAFFVLQINKSYSSGGFSLLLMEPYLVARVISEIFILAGLMCFFSRNRYASLLLFVISALMHPLMGGWTLPLWVFFFYPKSRIPILIITLLAPLSGFLHVGKLDFYPSDWRPLYYAPVWEDFVAYGGLLLVWFAMFKELSNAKISRFALCMFLISFAGFYLQVVSSISAHQFFFQAQPFRVGWLSQIVIIPVSAAYLYERNAINARITLKEISLAWIVLCAIAQYQNVLFLLIAGVLFFLPRMENFEKNVLGKKWRLALIVGLIILLVFAVVKNYISLALEQGVGDVYFAVKWIDFPDQIKFLRQLILFCYVFACISKKHYWLAFAFAFAFCNENLELLGIICAILFLVPNISLSVKKILVSSAIVFSFVEMLSALPHANDTQAGPLEGFPVASVVFIVVLFILSLWIAFGRNSRLSLPIALLPIVFFVWNIFTWDSRGDWQKENEIQMNAFFEKTIFPQVRDRGKLLISVDCESPIQSRINFMTGAYADESIYVGEVFYREQYLESNRRRAALLYGDSIQKNVVDFSKKILNVYKNPDTLLSRVNFLCAAGEITHFATDYADMPLSKEDSVFLDIKRKYVWLYKCP